MLVKRHEPAEDLAAIEDRDSDTCILLTASAAALKTTTKKCTAACMHCGLHRQFSQVSAYQNAARHHCAQAGRAVATVSIEKTRSAQLTHCCSEHADSSPSTNGSGAKYTHEGTSRNMSNDSLDTEPLEAGRLH